MQRLKFLIQYLDYLRQARNKYDIHSPFLFDFVSGVIENKDCNPDYARVEALKKRLIASREHLEVTDLGAGSVADKKKIRSIKSITRHSSKPKKYGRLLYRLAQQYEQAQILELGTAMGISTAYLALGSKDSTITSVEGCPNISKHALLNLESLGTENVRIINGNFDAVLPEYLSTISQLDLAFIDGNHREEPTINYFEQCLSKVTNTSCFVFDDIHWSEGMEKAWDHIASHPRVTLSLDLFFTGLVFFRKELSKQHFTIRF